MFVVDYIQKSDTDLKSKCERPEPKVKLWWLKKLLHNTEIVQEPKCIENYKPVRIPKQKIVKKAKGVQIRYAYDLRRPEIEEMKRPMTESEVCVKGRRGMICGNYSIIRRRSFLCK